MYQLITKLKLQMFSSQYLEKQVKCNFAQVINTCILVTGHNLWKAEWLLRCRKFWVCPLKAFFPRFSTVINDFWQISIKDSLNKYKKLSVHHFLRVFRSKLLIKTDMWKNSEFRKTRISKIICTNHVLKIPSDIQCIGISSPILRIWFNVLATIIRQIALENDWKM